MPSCVRCVVVLLLVLACAFAGSASAAPEDVLFDYRQDGVLDERHSVADLTEALRIALELEEPQYDAFRDAVGVALDEALGGVSPPGTQPFAPGSGGALPLSPLPSPQPPEPGGGPPLALSALTAFGGLLILAGLAASVYRRFGADGRSD